MLANISPSQVNGQDNLARIIATFVFRFITAKSLLQLIGRNL
jgi:hypothetical protein